MSDTGVLGVVLLLIFGFLAAGYSVGQHRLESAYKQCRNFDQPIERCVRELGWEKQ